MWPGLPSAAANPPALLVAAGREQSGCAQVSPRSSLPSAGSCVVLGSLLHVRQELQGRLQHVLTVVRAGKWPPGPQQGGACGRDVCSCSAGVGCAARVCTLHSAAVPRPLAAGSPRCRACCRAPGQLSSRWSQAAASGPAGAGVVFWPHLAVEGDDHPVLPLLALHLVHGAVEVDGCREGEGCSEQHQHMKSMHGSLGRMRRAEGCGKCVCTSAWHLREAV